MAKTTHKKRSTAKPPRAQSYPAALSQWIDRISKTPLLSKEEELAVARRVQEGDREAFQTLTQSNLRLVVKIATRYSHPNVPLIDLIQEGNIGLIQAVERYDPERGFRFSTYAVWWIRRAILRALSYDSRLIRLPEHILAGSSKVDKQSAKLRQKYEREPSAHEIAAEMDATAEQVELLSNVSYEFVSLDMELPLPGNTSLRDVLEDERQRPARWWDGFLRTEDVHRLLDVLSPRERAVLRARYGLDDGKPLTLKETGRRFNLTRERIRQIEKQAIQQLKEAWKADEQGDMRELATATF